MQNSSEKRMADHYEIRQAVYIGDKEVVIGVDETDPMPYLCAYFSMNGFCSSYKECIVSDDYVEIVAIFAERIREQCESVRKEKEAITVPMDAVTADMCLPLYSETGLTGKVAAVRINALRPEYRAAPYQLFYVTGGNGALGNARGSACFCTSLYDGKRCRWERRDIQGEVKPECLPDWAGKRAQEIRKERQERKER
ncbi:MAG: hypothetical protein NC293_06535 [Roseburia sp.]|nr:hypothetical protein [Roseburia sp.]